MQRPGPFELVLVKSYMLETCRTMLPPHWPCRNAMVKQTSGPREQKSRIDYLMLIRWLRMNGKDLLQQMVRYDWIAWCYNVTIGGNGC